MTITEKLNEFDKKDFLEGRPNRNLVGLFEAAKNKLTSKDIDDIKKIIDSNINDEDKQTSLQAVLDKKLNEDNDDDIEDVAVASGDGGNIVDKIIKEFEDKCAKEGPYIDYCSEVKDFKLPFTKLLWVIENGDWKHDHLLSEVIMEEVLNNNGIKPIKFSTVETDDSLDDTFSADHYVIFDLKIRE